MIFDVYSLSSIISAIGLSCFLWIIIVYFTSRAWYSGKEKQAKIMFKNLLIESRKERKEKDT